VTTKICYFSQVFPSSSVGGRGAVEIEAEVGHVSSASGKIAVLNIL
jgi:hypothetical protein